MATPAKIFVTENPADSNAPIINGTTVTGATTYYSQMWSGEDADGYGLQVEYTGTPTGTLTLWVSDRPINRLVLTDDTGWVQDTGFVPVNPAGAAGKFRDDAGNSKGYRKRLKYVNSAGTGTIFGYVTVPRNN